LCDGVDVVGVKTIEVVADGGEEAEETHGELKTSPDIAPTRIRAMRMRLGRIERQ
jgi:hypothetical protein